MKVFNKFVESKNEPSNKNDIWFDGSVFRIYKEGNWIPITLTKEATERLIEYANSLYVYVIVDELPESGEDDKIYILRENIGGASVKLKEYIWDNGWKFVDNFNSITSVTPDWNAEEGEVGYIANKPCFSLKTVNSRLDNLNPYFNTDFENGKFYPKHDLYVEYENKTIFMCKKDKKLYYGDGITIIDDNGNYFVLDGDSETGEICCVGGGYDFELIFSLDKKYIGFQSTEDTTVTPDWSAPEGKEGHILNRTHYKDVEIFENGGLKTNDDGEPISPNYIRFRNEYGNLSELILVDDYTDGSHIEGTPLYDEYGDTVEYIYGTLLFQPYNWTIVFSPEGDGIYYVDSVYKSLKQLDEEYLPDTVIKTTPQSLSDADKNQALANLGIDPVVWKYLCDPYHITQDSGIPDDLRSVIFDESGELKDIVLKLVVCEINDDSGHYIYSPAKLSGDRRAVVPSDDLTEYAVAIYPDGTTSDW